VAIELRLLLGIPALYSAFSRFAGGSARETYAREYIRALPGDRVLDIGCGPADILDFLPAGIEYIGFDSSEDYIASANARFGQRGRFFCADVYSQAGESLRDFDIVMANGVLHHLDDREARELFRIARSALKPEGRLVTLDGCYAPGQSALARHLLSKDRGAYVRSELAYRELAAPIFANVTSTIRHDLMRIPYTHIILECSGSAPAEPAQASY
jgi:SAM-dependent methyltransferase